MSVVEPKICELCRRPFYREVTIRALAEKDCPSCSEETRLFNLAQARYSQAQARIASRARIPYWTPHRMAERALGF